MNREDMQTRSISGAFKTRSEDGGEIYIEGYFSVFDSNYDLWPGASESVARGAFSETLDGDVGPCGPRDAACTRQDHG